MKHNIYIFIGKSASGKDTYLREAVKAGSHPIVSYTTRPIREGEENGIDYNFVSKDEFKRLINNNGLMEYRSYNTLVGGVQDIWYYGTPKLTLDKDYVGIVDIEGAIKFIKEYGSDNIELVYCEVSDEIRKKRAMLRGGFDETEWERRKADDDVKFSETNLQKLKTLYKKPIRKLDNNGDKPTLSWI